MAYNQLDIYICIFLIIMAIFGYKKGLITRLYDFASLFIVIYLSYILSIPLSRYFYVSDLNEPISLLLTQCINHITAFIFIFVILFIIKKIIGILIKPLLKKIVKIFSLTDFVNNLLGLILSLIEGIIISYIAIIMLLTPIYEKGYEMVSQSIISQFLLNNAPSITHEVIDLSKSLTNISKEHNSDQDVMNLLLLAYDYHFINDDHLDILIYDYLNSEIDKTTLTSSQYEVLNQMLDSSHCDENTKKNIIRKVNVSDKK